jgi:hypothetical protein
MSLNEKLRGILKKVKNSKSNDGVVEEIQALLEEDTSADVIETLGEEEEMEIIDLGTTPPPLPTMEPPPPPSVVTLEWEQIARFMQMQKSSKSGHEQLGALCLSFEEEKKKIADALKVLQKEMIAEIGDLRVAANLPTNVDYVLNLPAIPGESGSFVKAETN